MVFARWRPDCGVHLPSHAAGRITIHYLKHKQVSAQSQSMPVQEGVHLILDVKRAQPGYDVHVHRVHSMRLLVVVQRLGLLVHLGVDSAQPRQHARVVGNQRVQQLKPLDCGAEVLALVTDVADLRTRSRPAQVAGRQTSLSLKISGLRFHVRIIVGLERRKVAMDTNSCSTTICIQ